MKRFYPAFIISVLLLPGLFTEMSLYSQMPPRGGSQFRVTGWLDDNNCIVQTFDSEMKPVVKSINLRTGRQTVIQPVKTERELLSESLPSGVNIAFTDAVSDDSRSAALLRDNDLYYIRIGDKELRRLTSDEIPEVNARFSPDGKRIAYTKNKDLYVYDIAASKEIRLTSDASERVYNGY